MAAYKCGNCRETFALSLKARFCPECGSSSLILVVREQAEPNQRETVGVYKSATIADSQPEAESGFFIGAFPTPSESEPDNTTKEEEDRPRRRR